MKNVINYFYNLYPDKIYEKNGVYYFYINDIKFYVLRFDRSVNELNTLVQISNELYKKGLTNPTFLINRQNNFYMSYDDANYVILKINNNEREEIDLNELFKFNNLIFGNRQSNLYSEDWTFLWSKKVDTLENQVIEFNKEYPLLTDSFNYYIGLAENAISYVKNALTSNTKEEKDNLFLSHRRITMPLTFNSVYNPLTFIFDYEIRDAAEYIKAKFFENKLDWEEIEEFFSKFKFSQLKYQLFYGRLLYPSYYFDMFERIVYKEVEEKEISKITELSEKYEEFLYDMYEYLKKFTYLPEISWIIEKYQ
jgi:spore coat protein YutH